MTFRGDILSVLPRRGLNNQVDPLALDPAFSPDCVNVRFNRQGVYKRDGFSRYLSTAANAFPIVGIAQLSLSTGGTEQIVVADTKIYHESGGTWVNVTGGVSVSSNQNYLFKFAQLTDILIGSNGVNALWKYNGVGNAAALGGSPPGYAKAISAFKNYIVLLNTFEGGIAYPGRIRWSGLNNAESWPAANYTTLLNNLGQYGTGFGKIGDQLFAFFDRSIIECVYTGDSITPFVFPSVSPELGCVAGNAIVSTGEAIFFPGYKGIYVTTGGVPKYISGPIEKTWAGLNQSRIQYITGVHNRLYNEVWFAVSTASNTANDTLIVYDYVNDVWTLFTGVTVNAMGLFEATIPNNVLVGGMTGLLLKGNSGSYLDDGAAISAYCSTKPLDLGSAGLSRQIKRIQAIMQGETQASSVLTIPYAYTLNIMDRNVTMTMGAGGAVYDTAIYDTDVWAIDSQIINFARPLGHGRFFQCQVKNAQSNVSMKIADLLLWIKREEAGNQ